MTLLPDRTARPPTTRSSPLRWLGRLLVALAVLALALAAAGLLSPDPSGLQYGMAVALGLVALALGLTGTVLATRDG